MCFCLHCGRQRSFNKAVITVSLAEVVGIRSCDELKVAKIKISVDRF